MRFTQTFSALDFTYLPWFPSTYNTSSPESNASLQSSVSEPFFHSQHPSLKNILVTPLALSYLENRHKVTKFAAPLEQFFRVPWLRTMLQSNFSHTLLPMCFATYHVHNRLLLGFHFGNAYVGFHFVKNFRTRNSKKQCGTTELQRSRVHFCQNLVISLKNYLAGKFLKVSRLGEGVSLGQNMEAPGRVREGDTTFVR